MSLIRGVLLAGNFLTHHQLIGKSEDDLRNTLIFELATRFTNQPGGHFQAMDNATLAGTGAVTVFLFTSKIRTEAQLKTMTDDNQRNTLIVEIEAQTHMGIGNLQGLKNMDLVFLGLGFRDPAVALVQPSYIRGVLLAGKFRTHHELLTISDDNQRNTLIVELAGRTNQSNFQSFNDFDLAGAGALLVFIRETKIRTDQQIKTMTIDNLRNTLITELGAQLNIDGASLQSRINMDLVRLGLGADPKTIFTKLPPPLQQLPITPFIFTIDSFEIETQKADGDHSDSDWLSFMVQVINPITKNIQTLPTKTMQIGGSIKTGDNMRGLFSTDLIEVKDPEILLVNYFVINLGSSKAEEQFAQAVQVTDKVVEVVAPIAGGVIGFIVIGDPVEGAKIGEEVARTFDTVIKTLGDAFDFIGVHFGPANCNGEVLNDTVTYQFNELLQALNVPVSREIIGSQENDRCGSPPKTIVHFSVHH